MFAVVQVGNSQFKVAEGDRIEVNRLESAVGQTITLDQVLMLIDGETVQVGQPYVKNAKVTAKVEEELSAKKVIAYKYRRRKDSSTQRGHRQKLTALSITKISS